MITMVCVNQVYVLFYNGSFVTNEISTNSYSPYIFLQMKSTFQTFKRFVMHGFTIFKFETVRNNTMKYKSKTFRKAKSIK